MARYLRLGEKASQLAMTLGQNCREHRAKLKMSQSELSERSGVAASHLSHIENGRGNPTLEVMEKIGEALNTTVLVLLTERTPPQG